MELVEGEELFYYAAKTGPFSPSICRFYFKQILMGLKHMHSNGVCHRDIKPENILLDLDYNVKLINFGFTTELKGKTKPGFCESQVGTPSY